MWDCINCKYDVCSPRTWLKCALWGSIPSYALWSCGRGGASLLNTWFNFTQSCSLSPCLDICYTSSGPPALLTLRRASCLTIPCKPMSRSGMSWYRDGPLSGRESGWVKTDTNWSLRACAYYHGRWNISHPLPPGLGSLTSLSAGIGWRTRSISGFLLVPNYYLWYWPYNYHRRTSSYWWPYSAGEYI